MSALHAYQVMAQAFLRENVNTCFALLGDANMNWATALANGGCEFVYVRDEHCAVAAAMSWSRITSKVGIATVTCGPGLTQILTALPAAVRANIPLLIFAGEAPQKARWYNQAIEQRPFIEACGAIYKQIHNLDRACTDIRDAFLTAETNQCPVVIGVPLDLQSETYAVTPQFPPPSATLLKPKVIDKPDPDTLSTIANAIVKSKKPVVMAGRGAYLANAKDACIALADYTGALLATSLPARGLFREHPFSIGIAGGFSTDIARETLQQADLIIAVGIRLAHHNSDGGTLFNADNVIHIDIAPRQISQGRTASAIQLKADARLGVEAVLKKVVEQREAVADEHKSPANSEHSAWRTEQLKLQISSAPADSHSFPAVAGLHDPREVVTALDKAIPDSWTLVNSSGHCSYFFAQMPNRAIEHFLTIREFGAIGNGIAFAIGAALARPEHPVVLFDGDGSLLMHIQELETIVRHKLNILIVVLNDGAYGSEIHKLRAEGLSDEGAVFGRKDFARIANGFDVTGVRISDLGTLKAQINTFENNKKATLWDFHVSDQVVSPVVRRSHMKK